MIFLHLFLMLLAQFLIGDCLPEEGRWEDKVHPQTNFKLIYLEKGLYKGAKFYIHLSCETNASDPKVHVSLIIRQLQCLDMTDNLSNRPTNTSKVFYSFQNYSCNGHIFMKEPTNLIHVISHDGVYGLELSITKIPSNSTDFSVDVNIEIKNEYGYLSAVNWPLLQFYGFMCVYYIILGLAWLVLCFMQWRDLLRVQFWIGGVILLGMLEEATFYAEYQSINNTGLEMQAVLMFAEWISCAKKTLARILVIIVSLGFGIVKPRLGSTLHRVVGVGLLYFFLAASDAYLRTTKAKPASNRDLLIASIPLAVLDSAICWWIFSALVNTTRTLRLRRNETKLALYRHFTNTLIFSVVASVIFILYSIKAHRGACLIVWKDLWLEEAFWQILFSCILSVIMILWRPTNNNQRYAFVPLLDTGDDGEEEDHLVNDAYGVKVRVHHNKRTNSTNSVDDDLRWLEENVKSDPALPILDSDEELVNTRFEVSKMQ